MKPEYTEGPKALKNFERGMKALFQVPKPAIVQRKKRTLKAKAPSVRKPKSSDKD
jgi:hypothetical protein